MSLVTLRAAATAPSTHTARPPWRSRFPPGLESIAVAAVTDEPAGGSPQPTGSIHLAGTVSQPSS